MSTADIGEGDGLRSRQFKENIVVYSIAISAKLNPLRERLQNWIPGTLINYKAEAILFRSRFYASFSLFIPLAVGIVGAAPAHPSVPYFVDAAGPEYDLEQEARASNIVQGLPDAEQFEATMRNNSRRLTRWRVFLRSDGIWVPDPLHGKRDYADRHYPVEYVLPLGYRGAFQVAWGVQGASPLQIVDGKIEIYIPPTGIVETSSAQAAESGTVAAFQHQFYFELDGKRTVIPFEPQPNKVGIILGSTDCREMPGRCYSYFVGSPEEWDAATASRCRSSEKQQPVIASGHECFDVPPGSTKPVVEIVQPQGKPAIMASEFHGRTLNGRRVVLSIDSAGINAWRYEGSEPNVPDDSTLAGELKMYIETTLATNANAQMEQAGCTPDQLKNLLRLSLAGPYRFLRTPYSSKIGAWFEVVEKTSIWTVYYELMFGRSEQGWKLLSINYGRRRKLASNLETKISEFVGRAVLHKSGPVVLRQDGTWDTDNPTDDPSELQPPADGNQAFTGYDMNGGEIEFAIDDKGRKTWHRLNSKDPQIPEDSVVAELNQALDRYIELLSASNVKGFIQQSGGTGNAYGYYRELEKFGDESKEANLVYDLLKSGRYGASLLERYGESNFKPALKKWLLDATIEQLPLPSTLQELKGLRSEKPRIAPILFSLDFEALYTLPPRAPDRSQTIKRLTGRGARWTFDDETWNALAPH